VLRGASRTAGVTLVEVSVAILVAAGLLMASAAAFSSSLSGVTQAEKLSGGALFLETSLEDLTAQPFENLLALNGTRLYQGQTAAGSRYAIDVVVFPAEVNLLQVSATLVELSTGREAGRVTTLRSGR
jgi:hypothetical protein